MRVLILGGYGTFGGRLAELLADQGELALLIAGRSRQKAESFARRLGGRSAKQALSFDRDGDVAAQLRAASANMLVDASGPFQAYGPRPYRVVEACIETGVHYLDLADGADFVEGISRFDAAAKARGVYALTGVSSFPVLTAAVVRRLACGLDAVQHVRAGIAPSPYAGVGLNVIRAIASYSGKPVRFRRSGVEADGHGLTESLRYIISPPGYLPLRDTLFSLVDVPDLHALPKLWPGLRSIWIGAGPKPEVLHRMLYGLAWLVRLRLLPSLERFARLIHFVSNHVRWGEDRGGMFVEVEGSRGGAPALRSWHLVAEGNDGPYIPSMAVEAIVRKALAGNPPVPGARACVTELEVADYEKLFAQRRIVVGTREDGASVADRPLFQRVLGEAWERLPPALQSMHGDDECRFSTGVATVERGSGALAHLAARLFGFPAAGTDIPIRVTMQRTAAGEQWTRAFAGRQFRSVLTEGEGRSKRLLCERFGAFRFDMALVLEAGRLRFVVRRWRFLGFPLPVSVSPRGNAYETEVDGRFRFHVEIAHPLCGLIVRYAGSLERTASAPALPNEGPAPVPELPAGG
jgi:hypothetical protein